MKPDIMWHENKTANSITTGVAGRLTLRMTPSTACSVNGDFKPPSIATPVTLLSSLSLLQGRGCGPNISMGEHPTVPTPPPKALSRNFAASLGFVWLTRPSTSLALCIEAHLNDRHLLGQPLARYCSTIQPCQSNSLCPSRRIPQLLSVSRSQTYEPYNTNPQSSPIPTVLLCFVGTIGMIG